MTRRGRKILTVFFIYFALTVAVAYAQSQPLVIDHGAVEDFDRIPESFIAEAKKMWINMPGESHASGYRKGLLLLSQQDPRFAAVVTDSGAPEPYRTDALRISGLRRTQYNGWASGAGEDIWYTNEAGKNLMKLHLGYANTHDLEIAAIGFGWCWDMTWHNSPGGTVDSVHDVRWAGSSVGGPQGDLCWGLDADDYSLTGNTVCMDTYLNATEEYAQYCRTNNYKTRVLFTTGPVDGYSGESGYQRQIKHDHIRNFVNAGNDRILFDYADILSYSNAGFENRQTWNGNTYQMIHPDNMKDLNGSYAEDGDHIGQVGAIRLGKALWVLAARLAGWGGPTTHYIRADAPTGGDGSDWNRAWQQLPGTLERGHAYYVADGTYGSYVFDDAASGTISVYIKKATAADHGTDSGWQDAFGDGQAVFSGGLVFSSSYWVFDGQRRTSWTSGHGFKVSRSGNPGQGMRLDGDAITIQFVEIEGNGPDDAGSPADDGIYAIQSQTNLQFRYLYAHDFGRAPFVLRGIDNMILEYSFVARNEGHANQHSEGVSLYGGDGSNDNNTFRFNVWQDIESTGVIVVGNGSGNEFYGNMIYWTSQYPNPGQDGGYISNGSITSWTAETQDNASFHNNTIVIPATGGLNFATTTHGTGTGNSAYNNLYFCSGSIGTRISYDDGTIHDYNAYSGIDTEQETYAQVGISSGIFLDPDNYDFRLAASTQAGATLASPYDVDMAGVVRGHDGTWDRGAYEFVEGAPTTLYGDVSENGTISAYDASLAAQYAVGSITLTQGQVTKAEVSGNGSVSAYDASLIAQYAAGLITTFPVQGG